MNKTRTTETGEPDARVRITITIERDLLKYLDHRHVSRSEQINRDLAHYYGLMDLALKDVLRKCGFTQPEEHVLVRMFITMEERNLRGTLEGREVLKKIKKLNAFEHAALTDAIRRYRHCTKIGSPWRDTATLWVEPTT